MRSRTRILLGVCFGLLLVAGACRMPDGAGDGAEELPWNSPAGWEGRMFGAPI